MQKHNCNLAKIEGIYDLDGTDEAWLQLFLQKHPESKLDANKFSHLIFRFELDCYNGILSESGGSIFPSLEYDESTSCDVCGQFEIEEGNEMVFCDGCNAKVHQVCYGIHHIPEGQW